MFITSVKRWTKILSSFKVFSSCKFVIIFAFCCFLSVQFVLFWWKYLYVLPRRPTWHFFSEDIDPNSHWLYTRIWRDWSQERGLQHKQIHTNKLSHTHTHTHTTKTHTATCTHKYVCSHTYSTHGYYHVYFPQWIQTLFLCPLNFLCTTMVNVQNYNISIKRSSKIKW